MTPRGVYLSILLALSACLVLTACSEASDPVDDQPLPVTVLGNWDLTVVETADTCDATVPPPLQMTMEVEAGRVAEEKAVWFRDYGYGFDCWSQVLFADGQYDWYWYELPFEVDDDCNPGCRVLLSSRVDLSFTAGGVFEGVETITYEPVTPECDVPACSMPCPDPVDHRIWDRRNGRGCGFSCQTTYRWQGALSQVVPADCGP